MEITEPKKIIELKKLQKNLTKITYSRRDCDLKDKPKGIIQNEKKKNCIYNVLSFELNKISEILNPLSTFL